MRSFWKHSALVTAWVVCIVLSYDVVLLKSQLQDQEPRLERRDAFCHVMQFTAANASDNLRSKEPATRDFGLQQWKMFNANGWQMTNVCSAVPMGTRCGDDDLPCQLAALDWTIVNVR